MKKQRSKLHDELEKAAKQDEDRAAKERNSGLAILVLALLVVGLLVAIIMGGSEAMRP
jgi:type IV secretory pathway component VirB8